MKMENTENISFTETETDNESYIEPMKLSSQMLTSSSTTGSEVLKTHNQVIMVNKSWYNRLLYVQLKAVQLQYYLACYNTMGGAYHLCDQPKNALVISQKQEMLARQIGSLPLLFRALGYQYTNIGLMGYPKRATNKLEHLIKEAQRQQMVDLVHFLQANLVWMQQHLLVSKQTQIENESTDIKTKENNHG